MKKKNATTTRPSKKAVKKKAKKKVKVEDRVPPKIEGVPDLPEVFDSNVKGLKNVAENLTDTQVKLLNIIVSDFSKEPPGAEREANVFIRLRAACERAGMLDKSSNKQREFFRTLADPKFNNIVKATGRGLVGMYLAPLLDTQIRLALEGSQTALDRLFEIIGIKQSKYDFYLQRVALNRTDINVGGDLNYEGKTDAELKELVTSFRDVSDAEATVS